MALPSGRATVKAVNSGDTLVLVGAASPTGPPPELQVTLSSLEAPRLARSAERPDEAFAWDSREFLRTLCIGKAVQFKIEYKVGVVRSTGHRSAHAASAHPRITPLQLALSWLSRAARFVGAVVLRVSVF